MPVKAKKTSLTKALMVIMLVVRSTMGMATADLSPEDALRTFQASDTLDMDLTPHVSKQKRYLRSAADVTTTSTGGSLPCETASKCISNLFQDDDKDSREMVAVG
ncbi:unnamed protein product [Peronospora farinosa]|uniref:RxLR effector protein n=1 Tax=Peronospora farinosa TaxID=134698 RepID=A0ABN8CCB5_9STRA|nr:unnamed protein product [Peronospora farinosa]